MVGSLFDKISGFFDKRFVVTYWSPVFIGLGLLTALMFILSKSALIVNGWNNWEKMSATEQGLFIGGFLLIITLLAFVLEMLAEPILRLYEGYWPKGLNWLRNLFLYRESRRSRQVEQVGLRSDKFPRDPAHLLPTRLGNVLVAAYEYIYLNYRLDAFIWWPRLAPLLPEKFRNEMDMALSPVQAMLNLNIIFIILTIGGDVIALTNERWILSAIIFVGGLLLAYWCYSVAVNQAKDYGYWVRVAYDFHRHEILKQMHIPLPDNLVEERILWDALNEWVSYNISPWESTSKDKLPQLSRPFYYDKNK